MSSGAYKAKKDAKRYLTSLSRMSTIVAEAQSVKLMVEIISQMEAAIKVIEKQLKRIDKR